MSHLLLIIIFISLFFVISSNIIVIPFKILEKNSIDKSNNNPFAFLKNEIDKTLYTETYIGKPAQKITTIITFNSANLEMHHQTSKNLFSDTLYERSKSKTYKIIPIKEEDNASSSSLKQYFKEQIKLYNDINCKNTITINDLNFYLFEPNKKEIDESSLCYNIGFKLYENIDNNDDINTNLIVQLKQKKIISSYNFNFHFEKINIDGSIYNGFIIIGEEPHQYLKNSYNELQLYKTKACKRDNKLSWDIFFNKIYYKLNNEEYILDKGVEYFNQASLTPSSGIIEGTITYERNINKIFFSKLIKEKKCHKISENNYIFYYCDKNKINEQEIKNFPILYFSNIELNYIFELNYQDLFLEQDNILYFLVIFYDYPQEIQTYFDDYVSRWDLGIPFLKKYFFTFDYDNKYIGFYNNNNSYIVPIVSPNPMIAGKDNNSENKSYLAIIILLIIFLIIGILFILRKYFFKSKKISAVELESDIITDNNNSNLKYSKYHNVEMGQKNLLSDE